MTWKKSINLPKLAVKGTSVKNISSRPASNKSTVQFEFSVSLFAKTLPTKFILLDFYVIKKKIPKWGSFSV